MVLSQLLSDEQIKLIVNIIVSQCRKYSNIQKLAQELYYEPYMKMRKQHDVTGTILTGFRPDKCKIPGLDIVTVYYGPKNTFAQPKLYNSNITLNIVSSKNSLNSAFYLENCQKYNASLFSKPVYALIVFETRKTGQLSKIKLAIPDVRGKLIKEFELYSTEKDTITFTA